MIRHDDDQRVLRHTSTQQRQLGVDTLICADPLVGVPAVIVSDLVRVAQVHVCQSGRVRRFRRGHDTSAWIVIGDVVAATQRRLSQRGEREFRQSRTGDANVLFRQSFEYGRLLLQFQRCGRVFERDELADFAIVGIELRISRHAG